VKAGQTPESPIDFDIGVGRNSENVEGCGLPFGAALRALPRLAITLQLDRFAPSQLGIHPPENPVPLIRSW